jgi:molybdenum cofactor guanylyltransferase
MHAVFGEGLENKISTMAALTGLILAGGKSSRMGSDKALLEIAGKPLLQLQIERLRSLECSEILISGPKNRGYDRFGEKLVEDLVEDMGPLAGLCAGLHAAREQWILALAIDMPNVSVDFLKWLTEQRTNVDMVCPKSNFGFEPLCAVYRKSVCLPVFEKNLAAKELSLQKNVEELLGCAKARIVEPSEWQKFGESVLRNFNSLKN